MGRMGGMRAWLESRAAWEDAALFVAARRVPLPWLKLFDQVTIYVLHHKYHSTMTIGINAPYHCKIY